MMKLKVNWDERDVNPWPFPQSAEDLNLSQSLALHGESDVVITLSIISPGLGTYLPCSGTCIVICRTTCDDPWHSPELAGSEPFWDDGMLEEMSGRCMFVAITTSH